MLVLAPVLERGAVGQELGPQPVHGHPPHLSEPEPELELGLGLGLELGLEPGQARADSQWSVLCVNQLSVLTFPYSVMCQRFHLGCGQH